MNYDDPVQDLHIHQKEGGRKLTGDDAMQVIRWRQNNDGSHSAQGDLGRVPIQQDFLKAVAKQCLQPSTLLRAPALAQVFIDNVNTDLEMGNLLYFAQQAAGMDTEAGIVLNTMPWKDARYPGLSMILPDQEELLNILNDGMNPYLDDIQLRDLQLLYRNSNGSYGVTSGTLADPKLAYARGGSSKPSQSKPAQPPAQTPDPAPADPTEETPEEDPAEQPGENGIETPPENPGEAPETPPSENSGENQEAGQPLEQEELPQPEVPTDAQPEPAPNIPEGVPDWMIPPQGYGL